MKEGKMITNWKYNKWKKEWNPKSNALENYISLEVFPEDIEIFLNILNPNILEYKGGFIFAGFCESDSDENELKELFDSLLYHCNSIHEAEKSINELRLYDMFFNTSDASSDDTYHNIAKLIKLNWECHLLYNYPSKKFIVEIGGEYEQFGVTFYQQY